MTTDSNSINLIERLIAFDTTSRNSNLALMEFVGDYLRDLGVESELVHNDEGTKANLYATLGPTDRPGIALSGHTDVVPVDGQEWSTDPFHVIHKDGRLYGRGTSDMKSFIGICLALAPEFLARDITTPLHFAFSHDEEIGCVGVRSLIDTLSRRPIKPSAVIIGEPTEMKVVRAHKGKLSYRCHVRGHEAHSSLSHIGVNAVEAAAEAVSFLKSMARRHRDQGPFDADLVPPYTTVHTGTIRGGTALNIVPKDCSFEFEFRHLPEDDPHALLDELRRHVAEHITPEMHAACADTGFSFEAMSHIPGLSTDEDADVVQLVKALTGQNTTGKVSFGTEAGLFQEGGMPAVVCGPGSIEQAHKPDEFIALDQIGQCEGFLRKLFERCWKGNV
ncbi:MAG: acetylornithine deacetylase [Gammaproteobacteria bacterium]|nr:acetylornithine deacetylase [Gammaproteobacteria bacterium]MDX2460506.1 acetylornithine deacetylase [Gammaproteobacteria bacterium]